ncbi:MAG: recombinase family protein [Dehalococcoidia bacterium]
MTTAAIYCRVSTDNQETEGTSLRTQLEAALQYCKDRNYDVRYRLSEACSGLTMERPKLNELRKLVRAGEVDIIIAYCLDRLSRDPTHGVILTQEFEKHGVKLEAVTEDIDSSELGKLISYIRGFAAKLETEKTRERTMRGRQQRIKSGKLPTGRGIIYGYDYDAARQMNTANEELDVVRMAGLWIRDEGIFLNEVCRRLMKMRAPAPKGGSRWSRGTIGRIFRNPVYAGRTYAGRTRTQDKKRIACPKEKWIEIPNAVDRPAFTWEEWVDIQNQLDMNRERSPRNKKHEYLLGGRLFCRICGRRIYGVPIHDKPYYRCSGRTKLLSDAGCTTKSTSAQRLDEVVWLKVKGVLQSPDVLLAGIEEVNAQSNQRGFMDSEMERVERRLARLDKDQRELLQWALKGFPEELVVTENKRINSERTALRSRFDELRAKLDDIAKTLVDHNRVKEFCRLASEHIETFTIADKKLAFEALSVKVWLEPDRVTIEGTIPIDEKVKVPSQHL